jgi:hypothetical protein
MRRSNGRHHNRCGKMKECNLARISRGIPVEFVILWPLLSQKKIVSVKSELGKISKKQKYKNLLAWSHINVVQFVS